MVVFDLHMMTADDRREYRNFRKYLISSGYSFIQESVYVKLIRNASSCENEMKSINYAAPGEGSIIAIPMTLNDFKSIRFVRGNEFNFAEFSDPVVVF
jgi:CRISPR-associated protein Cas2